ncbi:MAG: caspase family protein [Muribaculaceae bacterium]|nr:caspase family protein [Muribaculaceae bacterium]
MKRSIISLLLLLAVTVMPFVADARNYVMCVGLSKYPKGVNSLRVSANDARTIANVYDKNGNSTVSIITDGDATRDAVISAMSRAFANAGPNDAVIFFFSGHGTKKGLACYDGVLSFDRILEIMKKCPARTKVVIADACYAGKMRGSKSWQRAVKNEDVMFFLSSRSDEKSRESRYSNSMFTIYLERGLRGGADVNRDRSISAREIYDFCHDGVIKSTNGAQHPVMWGKFNGNMPIITWNQNTKEYNNEQDD